MDGKTQTVNGDGWWHGRRRFPRSHEKRARVGSKPRESAHVEAVVLSTVTCSVFQADPLGRHVPPAPRRLWSNPLSPPPSVTFVSPF
ncbi:hypothetical protein B296_00011437 [Ensete ventricosum]|uniref:Uncharacterized protein n=1 Tax=Ensete ventricosum TaxID=4639 RepID=A0A426YUW7_ENSVE|nr:hypothetical protein B296_00011437 [Ensete ventricosum]